MNAEPECSLAKQASDMDGSSRTRMWGWELIYFVSCCLVCVTHRTLTWQKKKWPYCFYGRSLHVVKNNKLHMKKCYQMNNNKITLQLLFDMKSCMFPGPEEAITVP